MDKREYRPDHEHWTTVQVVALPAGWRAAFKGSSNSATSWTDPCPVILLQECRVITRYRKIDDRWFDERDELEPPYETRVVYGLGGGPEDPEIEPILASNFLGMLGPGQALDDLPS